MRFRAALVVGFVSLVSATAASEPGRSGGQTFLSRLEPTDVRWGEIAIVEGSSISLKRGPDAEPRTFPASAAIICTERQRKEPTLEGERPTASPPRRVGAIYVAVQHDGDRAGWSSALERLSFEASRQTPETFAEFASVVSTTLTGDQSSFAGSVRGVYCASGGDGRDVAVEWERRLDGPRISSTSSMMSEPSSYCAGLASHLEDQPPREVFVTRFVVKTARESALDARIETSYGSEAVPWPDGASVKFDDAPKGTATSVRIGSDEQGSYADVLRPARSGGPRGDGPYVARTRTRAAEIPRSALDGDVILTRWTWSSRELVMGVDPREGPATQETLDVAYVFTAPHGRVDPVAVHQAVASEFDTSATKPGITLLRRLLGMQIYGLGTEDVFAVFCAAESRKTATYCVGRSCSPVSNGESFCSALDARLAN